MSDTHQALERARFEGAEQALDELRRMLELRIQQATSVEATEALDNVIAWVSAEAREYRRRREALGS